MVGLLQALPETSQTPRPRRMVEPDGGSFPSRLTTRNRNIFELGMLDFNFLQL
jgi:hypothetical protein